MTSNCNHHHPTSISRMTWSWGSLLLSLLFVSLLCNLLLVWHNSRVDSDFPFHQSTRSSDGDHQIISKFLDSVSNRALNEQPIFGGLESIRTNILIYSLMIVVFGVISLEFVFSITHKYTIDTPYDELVTALEKELMIVGCTAFLFKVFINQNTILSHEWIFSLEYAELLIPIFAFSNCVKGYMLILLSYYLSFFWGRSYHLSNEELIIHYSEDTTKNWRKLILDILNPGVAQIEFVIVHEIFCDVYKFHNDAFAFDLYVKRVLEKLVLDMIEIRHFNWVFLIGIMCCYFIPENSKNADLTKCGPYSCKEIDHTLLFITAGCVVFTLTSITACVIRYYEQRLLRKRGVQGTFDYPHYLLFLNMLDHKNDPSNLRMDRQDLKKFMMRSKSRYLTPNKRITKLKIEVDNDRSDLSPSIEMKSDREGSDFSTKDHISSASLTYSQIPSTNLTDNENLITSSTLNNNQVQIDGDDGEPSTDNRVDPSTYGSHMTDFPFKMDHATLQRFSDKRLISNVPNQADFIKDIFLFGRPQLLFEFLQIVVIALSLYVSLWITNYAFLPIPTWLKFVAFLPYMGSVFSFGLAVKSAVLLKALINVERELVLEILEEEEATKALAEVLREQILSHLYQDSEADNIEQLKGVFQKYDTDGSNFLSRDEYKEMLQTFKVTYSTKKWRMIFSWIDRNYDGKISMDEFLLFVFPNSEEARRLQRDFHEDNCAKLKIMIPTLKRGSTMRFEELYVTSRKLDLEEGI